MYSKFTDSCNPCYNKTALVERLPVAKTDMVFDEVKISDCISDIQKKFCNLDRKTLNKSYEILNETLHYLQAESCALLNDLNNYSIWVYVHSIDVALISLIIACKLKYKQNEKQDLCLGALLHDIGKLLIPKKILQKPGRLNNEEMAMMKQHSAFGYNMIAELNIHANCKNIVLQHHERLDGSGYPFGLCEDSISDNVRIVMVADALDAMASCRPYRSAQTMDDAIKNLKLDRFKYSSKIILILEDLVF